MGNVFVMQMESKFKPPNLHKAIPSNPSTYQNGKWEQKCPKAEEFTRLVCIAVNKNKKKRSYSNKVKAMPGSSIAL